MLSNKLTFSLVFLVMLVIAFAVTPAIAQEVTSIYLGDVTVGMGHDASDTEITHKFTIISSTPPTTPPAGNGILTATDSDTDRMITAAAAAAESNYSQIAATEFPNLNDFFARGGTIEVLVPIQFASQQFAAADPKWHDVVITEIMWALDEGETNPNKDRQWIELYNNTGATKNSMNHAYIGKDGRVDGEATYDAAHVVLLFTINKYFGSAAHADVPSKGRNWISYNGTTWTGHNARPKEFTRTSHANAPTGATPAEMRYYKVVDRVSNMGRGGRQGPLPGQSGRVKGNTGADNNPSVSLISAFRKRPLILNDATGVGTYHDMHMFANGTKLGGWMASWVDGNAVRRINIESEYIATPGSEHFTPKPPEPTVLPVDGIVFNEIRNDISGNDLDWIELYNNSSSDVDIGNYEISIVRSDKTDKDLIHFQDKDDDGVDIKLGAGEYLLIVNRDPEDSIIADGKDITVNASNWLNLEGAKHLYYHPNSTWALPDTGKFMLILRSAKDKNGSPDKIMDVVGDLRITDLRDNLDTKVWPLSNWGYPDNDGSAGEAVGKKKEAKFGDVSFGSQGRLSMTWYRAKYEAGLWWHTDHWKQAGYMGGIGYRKDLDHGVHLEAPGTPGYVNSVQGTKAAYDARDATGQVTISEIMYDAGRAWDLVQWIELYNSSLNEAVDISDWTLSIRNVADHEEPERSFVDDEFQFEDGTIIPPNRTLLVVSATGSTNVPSNRVYDLFARHGRDLGLQGLARRTYLLSKTGFKLTLEDDATTPEVVDMAGNATVQGARVSIEPDDWALPPASGEGEARHSIIRLYGEIYNPTVRGNGYESALTGTESKSWRRSGLESGNIGIYYGHTDDFSTPGFRRGSALPVSLSSFRPVRDKATGEVVIRWITASELNNAGFNILRSETKTGDFKVVNLKGIIPGHGTTSEKHVYEWKDTSAKPNVVYYYRIEDVSFDGERATLATTHLRGNVTAAGKVTTTWGDLKTQ